MGRTVIEGDPECETSRRFFDLAKKLIAEDEHDD
jgi:nitrogenase iron protein NifH